MLNELYGFFHQMRRQRIHVSEINRILSDGQIWSNSIGSVHYQFYLPRLPFLPNFFRHVPISTINYQEHIHSSKKFAE